MYKERNFLNAFEAPLRWLKFDNNTRQCESGNYEQTW